MARASSNLVIRRMPWHANMTEMNHLGRALIAKPSTMGDKVTKIFSSYRYSDNPLTSMLTGTGREQTITSREWEWQLRGATCRPLVVIENVVPAANTTPGRFRQEFDIKLDENWWVAGDIIFPGTSDKSIQLRVQRDPVRHGSGWLYRVRLNSDVNSDFLPVKYLQPQQKWTKLFSQYEEAAKDSGSTQYMLPQHLKSRLSRYRKQYKVTGDVGNEVLAVKIPDAQGNMHSSWIKFAEVQYWAEWAREKERGYWYSRSTTTVPGSTGRPTYSGPGVQELLEDSNVHYYSNFTAKLVEEFLMDVFYSRVVPGGGARKIVGYTGEYGMLLFHRAVTDAFQKTGFITVASDLYTEKDNSPYHSNGLSFGAQFTKYKMANGIELELVHNPIYDDREVNFEIDGETGFPLESMRFTFLDFKGEGHESNIKLMKRKGGFKLGYVAGLHTPYGPTKEGLMSHSGDYYEMHVQDECGIHIHDITACGELILRRA